MPHWKKHFNYKYTGAYEMLPGEEKTLTFLRTADELVKNEKGEEGLCRLQKENSEGWFYYVSVFNLPSPLSKQRECRGTYKAGEKFFTFTWSRGHHVYYG